MKGLNSFFCKPGGSFRTPRDRVRVVTTAEPHPRDAITNVAATGNQTTGLVRIQICAPISRSLRVHSRKAVALCDSLLPFITIEVGQPSGCFIVAACDGWPGLRCEQGNAESFHVMVHTAKDVDVSRFRPAILRSHSCFRVTAQRSRLMYSAKSISRRSWSTSTRVAEIPDKRRQPATSAAFIAFTGILSREDFHE